MIGFCVSANLKRNDKRLKFVNRRKLKLLFRLMLLNDGTKPFIYKTVLASVITFACAILPLRWFTLLSLRTLKEHKNKIR